MRSVNAMYAECTNINKALGASLYNISETSREILLISVFLPLINDPEVALKVFWRAGKILCMDRQADN